MKAGRWREAALDGRQRALLEWTEKVVREPWACSAADVESLRDAGLDDRAIHDAAQVVGYFSYINRVVDALGCDLEAEMPPRG